MVFHKRILTYVRFSGYNYYDNNGVPYFFLERMTYFSLYCIINIRNKTGTYAVNIHARNTSKCRLTYSAWQHRYLK